MPSKEMRKTTIGMRSRRRSPLRNEFEVSPQIFWAECSTRWLSAQHFRSIIQPNYQKPPLCHRKHVMTPRGTPQPRLPHARSTTRQRLIHLTARLIDRLLPSRDRRTPAVQEDAYDHSHSSPASPASGVCLPPPVDARTGTHPS